MSQDLKFNSLHKLLIAEGLAFDTFRFLEICFSHVVRFGHACGNDNYRLYCSSTTGVNSGGKQQ